MYNNKIMKNYILFLLCFVFISFISCASTQKVNSSDVNETTASEELENIQSKVFDISDVQQSKNYILQSGDLVDIKVFMEPNMDRVLRISSNGTVTYPLVGNVKIGGYSVSEAEAQLAFPEAASVQKASIEMVLPLRIPYAARSK